MDCIKALRQENLNIIDVLLELLMEYSAYFSKMVTDHNLVIDALPSGMINDLRETAKFMVAVGYEKECSNLYSSCRREFVQECLSRLFGVQEIIEDLDNMQRKELVDNIIRRWIEASNVAVRILFPSERRLCDRVFYGLSSSAADLCFIEVCQEATIQLLNLADAFASGSPSRWRLFKTLAVFETLRDLIPEFQSLFSDQYSVSLLNEAIIIQDRLGEAIRGNFMELRNLIFQFKKRLVVPDGRLHPITINVMGFLHSACRSRQTLEQILLEYPKVADSDRRGMSSSFSLQMVWIVQLLERKLEAESNMYKDPTLRAVFMMNNGKYIEETAKVSELGTLLGDDWIRKNRAKVQQNLELYQRISWNKVLDYLKLDSKESVAPNEAAESMKEKLSLFNLLFEDICNIQSSWFVYGKQVREEIRIFLENSLSQHMETSLGSSIMFLVSMLMIILSTECLTFKLDSTICLVAKRDGKATKLV